MKRLLQIVSGMLAVLACVLLWRIVEVLRVAPPEFLDPPQLAAIDALATAPKNQSLHGAAMDGIVEGNLFESDRGQASGSSTDATGEQPLPPPTNVVLNGIFVMEGRPMAIVSDSTAGNKQLTLRVGDNIGDYQVGEIGERRVTLLGRGGQQFSLDLDIKKGAQAAAVRATAAHAATRPNPPAAAQTAAQRAAAARAAAANRATQSARARAAQGRGNEAPERDDPARSRLDALQRLREMSQR